ncbi:hypothetical protein AB1N83_005683 [Pleurotus pulmonarius]
MVDLACPTTFHSSFDLGPGVSALKSQLRRPIITCHSIAFCTSYLAQSLSGGVAEAGEASHTPSGPRVQAYRHSLISGSYVPTKKLKKITGSYVSALSYASNGKMTQILLSWSVLAPHASFQERKFHGYGKELWNVDTRPLRNHLHTGSYPSYMTLRHE